ncbi:light-harvesting protein [Allochromatium palmeri]|uniref:Light-harvesting protein n=2 Tax=Allochromatium palmeri TaxID=231048 RepID=A0A6N8EI14_9GAMM|nr:light-harvesting protein [Allochromatium palmeri]
MYKIWQVFDPRMALIGLGAFLFVLALVIHYMLLSSQGFDWLQGPDYAPVTLSAGMSALPAGR